MQSPVKSIFSLYIYLLLEHNTVLEPSGIPVTGTPSISLISNFINCRWALYKWNRWRTCYLFNNIDGVPVAGIPDGSRIVIRNGDTKQYFTRFGTILGLVTTIFWELLPSTCKSIYSDWFPLDKARHFLQQNDLGLYKVSSALTYCTTLSTNDRCPVKLSGNISMALLGILRNRLSQGISIEVRLST